MTSQSKAKRETPASAGAGSRASSPCPPGKPPVLLSAQLPKSLPGEWNDLDPLRATVLVYSPRDFSKVLRWLTSKGLLWFLERLAEDQEDCGSNPRDHLLAAMEDLRFTARFLAHAARDALVVWESSPPDIALGHFADELALEIERIADTIDARIALKRGRRQ